MRAKRKPLLSHADRLAMSARQGGRCGICGAPLRAGAIESDHIVHRCRGGTDNTCNLRLTCRPCNRRRGARL